VIEIYDTGPMGDAECALCKQAVYIAWDDDMNRVALDPDPDGTVAVSLDGNRLPWCRDTRGAQLAFDESMYRLHDPGCPGLARVIPFVPPASRPHPRLRHTGAQRKLA